MEVYINRFPVECPPELSLAGLLQREKVSSEGIAVAVDNKVVPKKAWNDTFLSEGAKVTVIRAVCGG